MRGCLQATAGFVAALFVLTAVLSEEDKWFLGQLVAGDKDASVGYNQAGWLSSLS